ncbi:hypothetical protein NXX06_20495 [Bacteroides uniformis]|nr:hypothetical protein [Bacteroides uniformis]MCS2415969.1 hypothetical protein [Bacteroides uniformis]
MRFLPNVVPRGLQVASFLQDICHREGPARPVTCGMDQVTCVLANGFAAMIDVPGLNYRAHRYVESYETLPQEYCARFGRRLPL